MKIDYGDKVDIIEEMLEKLSEERFIEKTDNEKYSLNPEFQKCIDEALKADNDIERAIQKAKWAFRFRDS